MRGGPRNARPTPSARPPLAHRRVRRGARVHRRRGDHGRDRRAPRRARRRHPRGARLLAHGRRGSAHEPPPAAGRLTMQHIYAWLDAVPPVYYGLAFAALWAAVTTKWKRVP